jgi:hypothetical protein
MGMVRWQRLAMKPLEPQIEWWAMEGLAVLIVG